MTDRAICDVHCSTTPSNSQPRFKTEASSHYSTNIHSSTNPTPRTAIVEAVQPKTKTLTVTRENGSLATFGHPNTTCASTGSSLIDNLGPDLGYYRLDRLDSVINPSVTSKLDRMAQQLGFQLPVKSHPHDHNSDPSDWEEFQFDDNLPSHNSPSKPNEHVATDLAPSMSTHKRSIFSSLTKRFSIPRQKTVATKQNSTLKNNSPAPSSKSHRGDSKPRRLRRWFSRHFRRSRFDNEEDSKPREAFTSTETILENDLIPSTPDGMTNDTYKPCTELDNTTKPAEQPEFRPSLSHPDQVRYCVSLEELGNHSPLYAADQTPVPSSSRVAALKSDYRNGQPLDHSSPQFTNFVGPKSSAFPPSVRLKESTTQFLLRESSLPVSDSADKTREKSTINGVIGENRATSLSVTKLVDPHRSTVNQSGSLSANPYTPSYLSISVAAFGYSGYTRHSLSSTNLANTPRSPASGTSTNMKFFKFNTLSSPKPTASNDIQILQARSSRVSTHDIETIPTKPSSRPSPEPISIGISNVIVPAKRPNCLVPQKPMNGSIVPKDVNDSSQVPVSHCNGADALVSPKEQDATKAVAPSPCPSSEDTPSGVRLRRTRTRSSTGTSDDHFQRSSLIMLAVAHASPRTRTAPPLDKQMTLSFTEKEVLDLEDDEQSFAQDANGTTVFENGNLALTNGASVHHDVSPDLLKATDNSIVPKVDSIDGHHFLRLVAQNENELNSLIHQAERDLSEQVLDEESAGLLRAAIGKARLLIAEKFAQFRGLCQLNLQWEQNARQTPSPSGDSEANQLFTSVEDLDGFWAIVTLQIDDVHKLFDQVEALRSNGWQALAEANNGPFYSTPKKISKPLTSRRKPVQSAANTERKKEDEIARMKARERLQSIKKEMRAKQQLQASNDSAFMVV